jgi:HAE1 family hydrophobic/amphiphilic exporter-1
MTLSDLAIKRPVFAWMLMAALIVFGAICLGRIGISKMPDVDFPVLNINVTWEGAAPDVLESEIVEQIEEKVIAVDGLKEIRSTIRLGQANIKLEFDINRNVDVALQDVQSAIGQVRLPLGVDSPTVRKQNPEEDPIMFLGLASPASLTETVRIADLLILDELQTVPGVGEVTQAGFAERNLRIWLRNDDLRRLQLTALDVANAIAREHTEIAAGYIENERQEINLRTMGEGLTPEEVGNILITERGGQPIYDTTIRLRDVARIEDGLNDLRRLARVNGQPGIGFGIKKQRGTNEVEVARGVRAKMEELNQTLPEGYRLQVNADFTRFTEKSVKATQHELVVAAILTALICYLFLGSWSSALNVILAIPTSIIGTFMVLYFLGFTLNIFTLLALALVIGIVVDDAIMILENIVRHFQMGKDRVTAAHDGAREIVFAATATTIAVVAIFLPVAFMEGIIGKFFFQFGIVLSAAVLLSLLEAVTLTPMRCSQFMVPQRSGRISRAADRIFQSLAYAYGRWLEWALGRRILVLAVSFALFAASLLLFAVLRKELVPPQDEDFVRLRMRMPTGTSLTANDQAFTRMEEFVKASPHVERYFSAVGGFGNQPNEGIIAVTLKDRSQRPIKHTEFMQLAREAGAQIPGLRVFPEDNSLRGLTAGSQKPVVFNIRGPDFAVLNEKAAEIMKRLEETGLVRDLDTSYRTGQPEVRIIPDREAAARRGVTMANIGQTINIAMGGVRQGKFTNDGRRYDVRLRLEQGERLRPADIEKLQVRTSYGELIPITDVVRLEEISTVQSYTRINRQRAITISGDLTPRSSQADALAAAERISREVLPPTYSYTLEGGAQAFQEAFQGFVFVFVVGLIAAYMVLASQFNSFIHPVTVLLALPFSITGAFLTLWGMDQSINLYSAIGIVLLAGICKKNSIMLVEFANQMREHRILSVHEALMRACPIRLRPILMTSMATAGAAVPIALGIGPGAETRAPMASAIIGGVAVSTLFTLFVVPCAYSLFARWEKSHSPASPSA